MKIERLAVALAFCLAAAPSIASEIKTGAAPSASAGKDAKIGTGKSGSVSPQTSGGTGSVFLTEQECTRLGGTVTTGIPNDSTCKTNTRCKTTLANGDIRSICVDEVAQ